MRSRSSSAKWTEEFPWVKYDESENVMICMACKKLNTEKKGDL